MATNVIMPALGMSQDTGKVIRWLKAEGQCVVLGEPLLEIETDKAAVELEAPASGVLAHVTAFEGDEVPVAQVIALILAPGEPPAPAALPPHMPAPGAGMAPLNITPVAARIAQEHGLDVRQIKPRGGRIEKADVLAYIEGKKSSPHVDVKGRLAASPKARRLAAEGGTDLATIQGSGPDGAVLAADVLAAEAKRATPAAPHGLAVSNVWRIMAERVTHSWTAVPHFYLVREVNASRLIAWRQRVQKQSESKITYTDLLVKIVATALRQHPRVNAMWNAGAIVPNPHINVGIAAAVEDGLVVPVICQADHLSVGEIARRRRDLVARAQARRLRLEDLSGGTFTISNLGMYGVDAFDAIINPPQAALLAVGRIAERVVPVNGQPAVQSMLMLSLSCDHRVVDGVHGARFLETMADLIEEPLGLLQ